tara:strand:+ start:83 stop:1330 length:1248 start_codon:yes stop_codon:yes gene_type:complete
MPGMRIGRHDPVQEDFPELTPSEMTQRAKDLRDQLSSVLEHKTIHDKLEVVTRHADSAAAHKTDPMEEEKISQNLTQKVVTFQDNAEEITKRVDEVTDVAHQHNVSGLPLMLAVAQRGTDLLLTEPGDTLQPNLPVITEETVAQAIASQKEMSIVMRPIPTKTPKKALLNAVYEWIEWSKQNDYTTALAWNDAERISVQAKEATLKAWKNDPKFETMKPEMVKDEDGNEVEEAKYYQELPRDDKGRIDYTDSGVDIRQLHAQRKDAERMTKFLWMGEKIIASEVSTKPNRQGKKMLVFKTGSFCDKLMKHINASNNMVTAMCRAPVTKDAKTRKSKGKANNGVPQPQGAQVHTYNIKESPHLLTAIHLQQKQRAGALGTQQKSARSRSVGRRTSAARPTNTRTDAKPGWMHNLGM